MAKKGELDLSKDLRVLRTHELCSAFQALAYERAAEGASISMPSIYSSSELNAVLLHECLRDLEENHDAKNALGHGLLISTPFNDAFALFLGLIPQANPDAGQSTQYQELTGQTKEHIQNWLIENPRIGFCLINKANVKVTGKKLIQKIQTNAFNELSVYQATLRGSKGFYAKALADSASFNLYSTTFLFSRSASELCSPIPMTRMSSPQLAIMLPSIAETMGYVLDDVLRNNLISEAGLDALNTPSERGKYLTTGLTSEMLENYYLSLADMARFFDKSPRECALGLNQQADVEFREDGLAFWRYLSALNKGLNENFLDTKFPNCLPVSSLINLREKPAYVLSAELHTELKKTLNRLVGSLYVVELVQQLDTDDLSLAFRFACRTSPRAIVIQKLIDPKNPTGERAYPSEKQFKPTLMYETVEDCFEPLKALNELEGDSENSYAPFKALALTADEWLYALRFA